MAPHLRVLLEAEREDLVRLAEVLDGPIRLEQLDDRWVIHSPEIDAAVTAAEAFKAAKLLIPMLVGISRLTLGRALPLRVGRVEDGQVQHVFAEAHITASARVQAIGVVTRNGVPVPTVSVESIGSLAYRLRSDPRAALVVNLMGEEPSWPTLYKVLDAIEEDLGGGKPLEALGWVPAADLRRFTRNANAIENAATGGRHAKSNYKLGAPGNAMSLQEAAELMESLVTRWLRFRGSPSQ